MEGYFSNKLQERQSAVVNHFLEKGLFDADQSMYFKGLERPSDLSSIDIVIFPPSSEFNYYLVSTAGLSAYILEKGIARGEICMILHKSWNNDFEDKNNNWVLSFLNEVAKTFIETETAVVAGAVADLSGNEELNKLDIYGAIVVFPELFPIDFFEEQIGLSYTRFYCVIPLSKKQVEKLADVGEDFFMQYDLHDASGPLHVIKQKKVNQKPIDKIISNNISSLKGEKKGE